MPTWKSSDDVFAPFTYVVTPARTLSVILTAYHMKKENRWITQ